LRSVDIFLKDIVTDQGVERTAAG